MKCHLSEKLVLDFTMAGKIAHRSCTYFGAFLRNYSVSHCMRAAKGTLNSLTLGIILYISLDAKFIWTMDVLVLWKPFLYHFLHNLVQS